MTELFGTDGIRGTVGAWPLVPDFFVKLGKCAGQVLVSARKEATILIGRDTRASSVMLQSALVAGLLDSGANVIDVEVITTPGVAWLAHKLDLDAGAVISASHNPLQQNGVKFFDKFGLKLSDSIESQIEKLLAEPNEKFYKVGSRMGRLINSPSMKELYMESLLDEHPDDFLTGIRVLADCSNGAASNIAPEVLSRAGADVIAVHASPSGTNINLSCGSERARRYPEEVGEMICMHQANFGLAFDGDADRVVFIDSKGNLIDGDHMLGLLARYFQEKNSLLNQSVVTTTMRNTGLTDFLTRFNIQYYETPVGDKYVTEKLLSISHSDHKDAYGLGGEQSGHVIILDEDHTTGDGIRTALFVMRAFKDSGQSSMNAFANLINKTPQLIASASVGNGKRLLSKEIDELKERMLGNTPGLLRANLRYSGTEPLFRVMLESDGTSTIEELAQLAKKICMEIQFISGNPDGEIDILNCTSGGQIA